VRLRHHRSLEHHTPRGRSCHGTRRGNSGGEEFRVRIPKRVNAVWDWAEDHGVAVVVTMMLLAVAATALWLPAFAAAFAGLIAGGLVVRLRMAKRAARMRAEIDELLRENGALRHQNTRMVKGAIAAGAVVTQRLPIIPDDD